MNTQDGDYYESDRAACEYLLFHFGSGEEILPRAGGPTDALDYPKRCVSECVDPDQVPNDGRCLDLGCAVGRSSFELARLAGEVIGIDYSHQFIRIANHLRDKGSMTYAYAQEGDRTIPATAIVSEDIHRDRVTFEQGDAQALRPDLGVFDVVVMANLIDRLHQPRKCLKQLPDLVKPGGQLIITSPYTWLEAYTPRKNWLSGNRENQLATDTLGTLKTLLSPSFRLDRTQDMPFLIREHARKFQWSVAEASIWFRS